MDVRGFWLAFTIGILLQDLIVGLIIVTTNWQAVTEITTKADGANVLDQNDDDDDYVCAKQTD